MHQGGGGDAYLQDTTVYSGTISLHDHPRCTCVEMQFHMHMFEGQIKAPLTSAISRIAKEK